MKLHEQWGMNFKKFATQVDADVLEELKKYAAESDRSISGIVSESIREYLAKVRVRPVFRSALEEVLNSNEELLKRLAK